MTLLQLMPGCLSQSSLLRRGLVLVVALATLCWSDARAEVLSSPNGQVKCQLTTTPQLSAALSLNDQQVAEAAGIGLRIDGVDLGEQPKVLAISPVKEVNETYRRFGAHSTATNHYNEYVVQVQSQDGQKWSLEFRLFDDAVAYRLKVDREGASHIDGDFADWQFPVDATIWQQGAGNRSYEGEYLGFSVGGLETGSRLMIPTTMVLADGSYAMITEANLVHYSDMVIEVSGEGKFRQVFHDDSNGWEHTGDIVTPWRVVVMTDNLNQLVNSDVVSNLCPPPNEALQNAEWIKPGRCCWHWLVTFHPRLEDQEAWIDGTSELGWEYYLIDDGWRNWNGGDEAAWQALADLVKYAEQRDVQLWAWVDSKYVFTHQQREAYFAKARSIGLVGLKIDFPHPANREWVDWYDATLADAAQAHLMINFHGALKPTGRERTWPNELTREAIRGRKQGKLPASHDTALPFVRYVQGPADYTPTVLAADKLNGSTVAHELAMAVVYTSPLLCMGDSPAHYLESDAADLLKAIPSTWDETIVLPGSQVGSLAAFARRKGDDWFIGVLNAKAGEFEIDTRFLGDKQYQLVELRDTEGENAKFDRRDGKIAGGQRLSLRLSADGGYVAWLRPVED
ncbi:glycoside hydrolase family 97 protein [Aeoliella mucimassa]|uniref:Retaining alpha-galactosidase n=1 Tax=Aeoliella mucimassa TaxID=2527972 RepID=A0A518AMI7_9BACT|nr:glycoside hydrolase family 97 protein [Aeoliella mucimassa]QDU55911.1 Retaining alpha-galactosidase precursor [Aeoliella mucimassa]